MSGRPNITFMPQRPAKPLDPMTRELNNRERYSLQILKIVHPDAKTPPHMRRDDAVPEPDIPGYNIDEIARYVCQFETITSADIQDTFAINRKAASMALIELKERGIVEYVGVGKPHRVIQKVSPELIKQNPDEPAPGAQEIIDVSKL